MPKLGQAKFGGPIGFIIPVNEKEKERNPVMVLPHLLLHFGTAPHCYILFVLYFIELEVDEETSRDIFN